jgi:hypothetical protein
LRLALALRQPGTNSGDSHVPIALDMSKGRISLETFQLLRIALYQVTQSPEAFFPAGSKHSHAFPISNRI